MKKTNNNASNSDNSGLEERVSAKEGFAAVAEMFTNKPEHLVMSDDEVLNSMKKDLEKRIAKTLDPTEKAELKKELLILEILIIQREKIDKEASIILNNGEAFGKDYDSEKETKKRRKARDKKQKDLIDKLNELNISNIEAVEQNKNNEPRSRGGMERRERTR